MINNRSSGASKWALISLFSVIALILTASGYWFYRQEAQGIRNHANENLKAIAELKVNQIISWRKERIGDARLNSSSPFLRTEVVRWLKTPDNAGLKDGIRARLQLLKESYGYENVLLTDTKGRVLLTLNPRQTNLENETEQLIAKAVSDRHVVFGDFFRCSICKQVHLDVAAPVLDQAKQAAAVLILRSNPASYLYPLIQSWPTASKSGETLLIRKEGDDAIFLNVLRHRPDPALTLRIPLSRTQIPAVQAILGRTELFEGFDYRGVPVLADIRSVTGSPWFMVAKVDKKEILSEAAAHARLIGLLTLSLVLLAAAGTAFVYKNQGKRTFQALYQAERERAEIAEQARITLYSIGDAVITTGADGRVKQMNPVAEQLTGWNETEALGKSLAQVFHIINEETRAEVQNPVEHVLREGLIVGLANHTLLIAKDGSERPIADSGAPIRNEAGEIIGVVLVFRDQTEERNNQAALQESLKEKALLADLIERSSQPLAVGFPDGKIGMVNSAFCKLVGFSLEELKSLDWANVLTPPEWRKKESRFLEELTQTGIPVRYEKEYIRKDGSRVPIELLTHLVGDETGRPEYYYAFVTDITERKKAEENLRKERFFSESIISSLPGVFYLFGEDGKFIRWNKNFEVVTGRSADEMAHINPLDLFEGEEKDLVAKRIQEVFDKGAAEVAAYLVSIDGSRTPYHFTGLRIVLDGRICLIGMGLDITERTQAGEALRESEIRFRTFSEKAPLGISLIDADGRYEYVNPAFVSIFGWDLSDISTGRDWFKLAYPDPDYRRQVTAAWNEDLLKYKEGDVRPQTYEVMSKDGTRKIVLFRPVTLPSGKQFIIYEDISERIQAEEAVVVLSKRQEAMLSAIPDIIMEVDENKVYTWANQAGHQFFGEDVIGKEAAFYFEGDQKTYSIVQPIFNGNEEVIYLESWQRRKDGQKQLLAWWCRVLKDEKGNVRGALSSARDITIHREAEERVIEGAEKLRKAIAGIVQAMAATVEVKDPYTAGHQRRVADLSRVIAQEMGFSDDRIEGIHMAGMIHDLGKLSVPAEILSKPTQLSEIEFSLIKVHPQAGYDILKGIDFPWPIARIVFQHHERINGSGYPLRLKAEEILPEAKVLAVADVVEAIASYRPYRPALGIEKALEEIQQQKGILYDSDVVEVCLKLFREKGYSLG